MLGVKVGRNKVENYYTQHVYGMKGILVPTDRL